MYWDWIYLADRTNNLVTWKLDKSDLVIRIGLHLS